jgi:hypothetical protein
MFRRTLLSCVLALIGIQAANADQWVNGYTRQDGTSVEGHWRSDADGNPHNNWSTKGNWNPYTGKPGSKNVIDYRREY